MNLDPHFPLHGPVPWLKRLLITSFFSGNIFLLLYWVVRHDLFGGLPESLPAGVGIFLGQGISGTICGVFCGTLAKLLIQGRDDSPFGWKCALVIASLASTLTGFLAALNYEMALNIQKMGDR